MWGERQRTRQLRALIVTRPAWSHLGAALEPDGILVGRARDLGGVIAEARMTVPDVLVVDADTDPPAVAALSADVRDQVGSRVLLVAERDDAMLYRAVLQGAHSVVRADTDPVGLAAAVRGCAAGESVLPPGVTARLLLDLEAFAVHHSDPIDPPPSLTTIELDVCERLADRMSVAEIAAAHGSHPRLVARQLGFAVRKLHVCYRMDRDLFDEEFEATHLDELP